MNELEISRFSCRIENRPRSGVMPSSTDYHAVPVLNAQGRGFQEARKLRAGRATRIEKNASCIARPFGCGNTEVQIGYIALPNCQAKTQWQGLPRTGRKDWGKRDARLNARNERAVNSEWPFRAFTSQ